jgi:hypothetical protein
LLFEKNILAALLEPEYALGNVKLTLGLTLSVVLAGFGTTVILPVMTVGFKKGLGRSSPYKNTVLVLLRS